MTTFRVIIVGGSVAGLTLASILQRYGIDFIVLEKYPKIAPQLGASIGVLPYGFQILDQLGVTEKIEEMGGPMSKMRNYGPDGEQLYSQDKFGETLEQLTGYQFNFLDRRELIQVLYDSLEDKSKVQVSQELIKVERLEDRVIVTTKDGHQYTGSILVGADGVHSRTRDEVWRIAESEDPTYSVQSMANAMTCSYRCMFGISDRPECIPDDTGFKTYKKDRSYLYQAGSGGKLYFFAFLKNAQATTHLSIPKYTIEDEKAAIDQFGGDVLLPGLTFGDIYDKRRSAVLTPLQEYVLERCFHKRGILIGDAFHKFNPLTGQGGNSAIEDAALLADLFKEMLDTSAKPTNDQIQAAFSYFERERRPRAEKLMKGAQTIQKIEALENPFLQFLNLHIIPKLGVDKIMLHFAEMGSPGHVLRYLPLPSRGGILMPDQHVIARPRDRSPTATRLWAGLILGIAALFIGYQYSRSKHTGLGPQSGLYILVTTIAFNTMWTIESYRLGAFGGPLYSALLYTCSATFFGWELIFPIYAAIFIYSSRNRPFYYPNPRAIDLRAAEYISTALAVAYFVPILLALGDHADPALISRPITSAHLAFPILVFLGQKISKKGPPSSNVPVLQYGTRDLPFLKRSYAMVFIIASVGYIAVCQGVFQHLAEFGFALEQIVFILRRESTMVFLALGIVIWCEFTIWDLKRTNVFRKSALVATLGVIAGIVLVGPASTLIGVWAIREWALEDARRKK